MGSFSRLASLWIVIRIALCAICLNRATAPLFFIFDLDIIPKQLKWQLESEETSDDDALEEYE